MCQALREIMAPEIEESYNEGREEDREEGRIELLLDLANDNMITFEEAASKAGMTVDEFRIRVKERYGY